MLTFFTVIFVIAFTVLGWRLMSQPTGANLSNKSATLGNLTGRTKGEIIMAVGKPNAVSATGEGLVLLQWQEGGYHIAILFKDGIFEGITHEFSG